MERKTPYDKIKEHCEIRAMGISDLSFDTRMSLTTIKNMKTRKVSSKTIRRIADALNLTDSEVKEIVELNTNMPIYRKENK